MTGFTPAVRSAVTHRSRGNCEARLDGCHGRATHMHHRKLRSHGDHTETNALHVCGRCHLEIHTMGAPAYERGLLVHGWDDPTEIQVRDG